MMIAPEATGVEILVKINHEEHESSYPQKNAGNAKTPLVPGVCGFRVPWRLNLYSYRNGRVVLNTKAPRAHILKILPPGFVILVLSVFIILPYGSISPLPFACFARFMVK
jgi:hypothetical protein